MLPVRAVPAIPLLDRVVVAHLVLVQVHELLRGTVFRNEQVHLGARLLLLALLSLLIQQENFVHRFFKLVAHVQPRNALCTVRLASLNESPERIPASIKSPAASVADKID